MSGADVVMQSGERSMVLRVGEYARLGSRRLAAVAATARRRVGLATLRGAAGAALLGLVTCAIGGKDAGLTVETGILFSLAIATLGFLGYAVLELGLLEYQLGQITDCDRVKGQKIATHKAIWAWVYAAELRMRQVEGHRAEMELGWLVENVKRSIECYPFFPASHVTEVERIAGDLTRSADDRFTALTSYLHEQLVAGAYLV